MTVCTRACTNVVITIEHMWQKVNLAIDNGYQSSIIAYKVHKWCSISSLSHCKPFDWSLFSIGHERSYTLTPALHPTWRWPQVRLVLLQNRQEIGRSMPICKKPDLHMLPQWETWHHPEIQYAKIKRRLRRRGDPSCRVLNNMQRTVP